MKTKQEVIQEAYGEYWNKVSNHHQYDGWIKSLAWDFRIDLEMEQLNCDSYILVRPKSLQGIEDNNGWTRIESEADLPQLAGYDFKRKYFTVVDGKIRDDVMFNVVFGEWRTFKGCKITKMDVTHYMDINIPPLPIF